MSRSPARKSFLELWQLLKIEGSGVSGLQHTRGTSPGTWGLLHALYPLNASGAQAIELGLSLPYQGVLFAPVPTVTEQRKYSCCGIWKTDAGWGLLAVI